jgi:hypothetical protein
VETGAPKHSRSASAAGSDPMKTAKAFNTDADDDAEGDYGKIG